MKKLIELIMALAMVLSLAACGGSDKPAESPAATETFAAPPQRSLLRLLRRPLKLPRLLWTFSPP